MGTVTFLFTDVEGSTARWDTDPGRMRAAPAEHDAVLREAIESRGGMVFKRTGDGVCAAFSSPRAALDAAAAAQERLGLPVRMGIATGEAELRDDDYFGPPVNLASRVMTAGHGGQVLLAAATAALVGEAGLLALGDHVFAGLGRPERVFQVGDRIFPPLRSPETPRSNLPTELSGFIGRDAELVEIADALGKARVVTLTGVGGVGKTRAALRVAANALDRFPDGVWLVELAPLGDAAGLVEAVAGALGVPDRPGQPLAAGVLDLLRSKQLLLVLDNCEHLGDAVAAWASGMLAASPGVRVLATSRRQLGVRGEQIIALSPLGVPAFGASLAELEQLDAVRLFVGRACEAKATFRLIEANAAAVGRLVRLLDGIPLAIELAAARVRSLSPAELADLFEQSGPAGGFEPLRRAVAWSYGLLGDAERAAINRASTFAGGFDLAAAVELLGADNVDAPTVVEVLAGLVDQSLLIAEEHDGHTRYRLLETIRQYAKEQLDAAGEGEGARRRHAEPYARPAAAADEGLRGRDEVMWTGRIEADLGNVRAALAWSVAAGDADLALQIVASLTAAVIGGIGYHATGAWAAAVVAMPGARGRTHYPEVLAWSGLAAMAAGDSEAAMRMCLEALDAADRSGADDRSRLRVLKLAVTVAQWTGRPEESTDLYERWAVSARAAGDDRELAFALAGSGALLAQEGDVSEAKARTSDAMALARSLGNPTTLCSVGVCAGLARMTTDDAAALEFFVEALGVAELVGNQIIIGSSLGNQAWIHTQRGEWRQAAPLVARSLAVHHRAGEHAWFRHWVALATVVLEAAGDDEAAASVYPRGALSVLPVIGGQAIIEQLAASEAAMRRRLGDDAFSTCTARGRAMGDDDIATYVEEKLTQVTLDRRPGSPAA